MQQFGIEAMPDMGFDPRVPHPIAAPTPAPAPQSAGFSPELGSLFSQKEQQYGLLPGTLAAIAGPESSFNPNARGQTIANPRSAHAGQRAQGMFQFMPNTWAQYGNGGDPFNPEHAADAAARFLSERTAKHGGNLAGAVADYYGRGKAPAGHPTTHEYVQRFGEKLKQFGGAQAQPPQPVAAPGVYLSPDNTQLNVNGYLVPAGDAVAIAQAFAAPPGTSSPAGFAPLQPESVAALQQAATTPDASMGGVLKSFGKSALTTVGGLFQSGAELVLSPYNASRDATKGETPLQTANPGEALANALGLGTQSWGNQVALGTLAKLHKSDIRNLSSVAAGLDSASAGGLAHMAAQGFGSLLPTVAAAMTMGPAAGAVVGAGGAGGGALDEGRKQLLALPEREWMKSPEYAALRQQGADHASAAEFMSYKGAMAAGVLAAPAGAFDALLPGLGRASAAVLKSIGSRTGRAAAQTAGGGLFEGGQEVAEGLSGRTGLGWGSGIQQNVWEGTGGEFVGGVMAGGPTSAAFGGFGALPQQPAQTPPPVQPEGTITDMFGAGNTPPNLPPAAPQDFGLSMQAGPVQDSQQLGFDFSAPAAPTGPAPTQGDLFPTLGPTTPDRQQQVLTDPALAAAAQQRAQQAQQEQEENQLALVAQRMRTGATPPAAAQGAEQIETAGSDADIKAKLLDKAGVGARLTATQAPKWGARIKALMAGSLTAQQLAEEMAAALSEEKAARIMDVANQLQARSRAAPAPAAPAAAPAAPTASPEAQAFMQRWDESRRADAAVAGEQDQTAQAKEQAWQQAEQDRETQENLAYAQREQQMVPAESAEQPAAAGRGQPQTPGVPSTQGTLPGIQPESKYQGKIKQRRLENERARQVGDPAARNFELFRQYSQAIASGDVAAATAVAEQAAQELGRYSPEQLMAPKNAAQGALFGPAGGPTLAAQGKPSPVKRAADTKKEAPNAVQERSAAPVDAEEQTGNGQAVGAGNPIQRKAAAQKQAGAEAQEVKRDDRSPEQARAGDIAPPASPVAAKAQQVKEKSRGTQAPETKQAEPAKAEEADTSVLTPKEAQWYGKHRGEHESLAGVYPSEAPVAMRMNWLDDAIDMAKEAIRKGRAGVIKMIKAAPGVRMDKSPREILAQLQAKKASDDPLVSPHAHQKRVDSLLDRMNDQRLIAVRQRNTAAAEAWLRARERAQKSDDLAEAQQIFIDTMESLDAKADAVAERSARARTADIIDDMEPGVDYGYEGTEGVDFSELEAVQDELYNDDVRLSDGKAWGRTNGATLMTYVIRDGETAIGHVSVAMVDGRPTVIYAITLDPDQRGKGWGRKVVQSLLDTSTGELYIQNVQPGSVDFWQRMGANWITENKVHGDATISKVQTAAGQTEQTESGRGKALSKRSEAEAETEGSNADKVRATLRKLFFSPQRFAEIVTVVQSARDLKPAQYAKLSQSGDPARVVGVAYEGKVILIADNIRPGEELSVFLHEVGVHLGMEKLIGKANMEKLVAQIELWAEQNGDQQEVALAKEAVRRAKNSTSSNKREEIIAYFIEGAVNAGIDPTAVEMMRAGPLKSWFRTLWAAAKLALRKIGLNRFADLTAQNLVDLAYGAAELELREPQVGASRSDIQFSEATLDHAERIAGPTARRVVDEAAAILRTLPKNLTFLPNIVDRWEKRVPALRKWYDAMVTVQTRRIELDQQVDRVVEMANKLSYDSQSRVSEFVFNSTMQQEWGYDPGFKRPTEFDPQSATAKAFNALSPQEQAVVKAMFQHGEDTIQTKRAVISKLGLKDDFARFKQLQGPYAPLRRFGNYMVEVKSDKLAAAVEAHGKDSKEVVALRQDPKHYGLYFRDTEGQAKALLREKLAEGHFNPELSVAGPRPESVDDTGTIPREVLQRVMAAVKADTTLDDGIRTAMEGVVRSLWFRTAEDDMARQAQRMRKYVVGADTDMFRSFVAQGKADAAAIAQLEHGETLGDATQELSAAAKNKAGVREFQDVVNTALAHQKQLMNYKETPLQDAVVGFTSAWQLATSLGYHLTNATQVAMVTVPMLAAKFNDYAGAWKHVNEGYAVWRDLRANNNDWTKISNPGARAVLELASKRNLLDVGMAEDFNQFNRFQTGFAGVDKASLLASRAIHKLRQVSRWVERMNRVAAGVGAYNMAKAKGMDEQAAQNFAIRVLEDTQGDFSALSAPLLLKKLPKFMTQYRKYQLMMVGLYARAFRDAFADEDPLTRAAGRRMLGYMMFHTSMAAGALGLPMMNLAAPLLATLLGGGDGEEPKNLERILRDQIGDKVIADLVLKGPLAVMGLDMSAKLGQDKLFDPLPYTKYEFSKKGVTDVLVGLMGPAGGMASRMADGVSQISQGSWYMGAEKLTPKGVEDALKGYRMATQGYQQRNGDVMVKPEDMGELAGILQMLGLPSAEIKRYQWVQGQQIEIRNFYKTREAELKREYKDAKAAGDAETMAELNGQWKAVQAGKGELRKWFNGRPEELKARPLMVMQNYSRYQRDREDKLQRTIPAAQD